MILFRPTAFAVGATFALALTLPVSAIADDPSVEEISSFRATIEVVADGTLSVTEDIVASFPEPRHGIDREIPVRYRTARGNRQTIGLTVTSVDDGAGVPVPFRTSRQGDDLRIRIGDADVEVTGVRRYRIRYAVERAMLFFDDHDELYWNVSGDRWRIPVRRIAADVVLPAGVAPDAVTAACYTGPSGSTAQDCQTGQSGELLVFVAREPLTIAVGFPKGIVRPPTDVERVRDFLFDNIGLILPLLVFLGLFWTWWTRGRDPKTGTVIAEYGPPDRLSPAEIDALKDEGVGPEAVSATIVDLAVRGYLRIEEKDGGFLRGKSYTLVRLKEAGEDLSARERALLGAIFGEAASVEVSALAKDTTFQKARAAFQKEVLADLTTRKYFERNPDSVRGIYFITAFGLFFLLIWSSDALAGWLGSATMTGLFVSVGLVGAFGFVMPRRLQKGAEAFRKAKGFKLYLTTAEKYRLEWQEKEKMFETYLPYAMVFGVVGAWVAAFKGVALAAPAWYASSSGGAFNPVSFGESVQSFGSAASRAIAPSSSGSSGGGSSGGGFGGGGGGSW